MVNKNSCFTIHVRNVVTLRNVLDFLNIGEIIIPIKIMNNDFYVVIGKRGS